MVGLETSISGIFPGLRGKITIRHLVIATLLSTRFGSRHVDRKSVRVAASPSNRYYGGNSDLVNGPWGHMSLSFRVFWVFEDIRSSLNLLR